MKVFRFYNPTGEVEIYDLSEKLIELQKRLDKVSDLIKPKEGSNFLSEDFLPSAGKIIGKAGIPLVEEDTWMEGMNYTFGFIRFGISAQITVGNFPTIVVPTLSNKTEGITYRCYKAYPEYANVAGVTDTHYDFLVSWLKQAGYNGKVVFPIYGRKSFYL